ncbi:hypothetical protein [Actinosynnema sp. NPDC020468]|uniref:hypothetical protein n=1 Tax=Actinosynnema sp. NPDC020468 TaxID=3154488 RepID=UPI0033E80488
MTPNPFSPLAVARVDFADPAPSIPTTSARRAFEVVRERAPGSGATLLLLGEHGAGKTHLAAALTRFGHTPVYCAGVRRLQEQATRAVGLDRLVDRVRRLHTDVVDTLAEVSVEVVDSVAVRRLEADLRHRTDSAEFARALTLVLDDGFAEAVWEWLTGRPPRAELRNQGVGRTLEGTSAAFETLGVLASLFGTDLVVVLDEVERVDDEPDAALAFQRLLEVVGATGAALVLCGGPALRESLRPAVLERIGSVVRLAEWTAPEVERYVRLAQEVGSGAPRLEPFTAGSIAEITDLTNGNPRRVIRLLHRCWRATGGALVTPELVRAQAVELTPSRSGLVVAEARRALGERGWAYERDVFPEADVDARVDLLVTFPGRVGACAVLVTDSVLDDFQVRDLVLRVESVRAALPDVLVVLLAEGLVRRASAARLREVTGVEVLSADRDLADDLVAAVGAMGNRLPETRLADDAATVLDRVSRQQSTLQRVVERLADRVDDVRAAVARTRPEAETRLPQEVERLFVGVFDVLDSLTRLDGDPDALMRLVYERDQVEAFGVALLLIRTVQNFRDAVDRDRRDLDRAALAYDLVVERLPLYRLYPLADAADTRSGPGSRARLHLVLDNLSIRVVQAFDAAG